MPTVMSGNREAGEAEVLHQDMDVAAHGTLGVGLVIRCRGRPGRLPVPAQVGAHDRVVLGEERGYSMPRHVGPRVPVQEDHRRPRASDTHAKDGFTDVDTLLYESLEHALMLCGGEDAAAFHSAG